MLRKLLKYEFKATARTFLPLYLLLLVFAGINRLFMEINKGNDFGVPQGIAMFLYVAIIVAIFVITFVITIQRFYRNLLTDEGYLMFTLPVKPSLHIWSKLIVAFVWNTISVVIALLSVLVLIMGPGTWYEFGEFMREFLMAMNTVPGVGWFMIFLLVVCSIVMLINSILQIYLSVVIGNLSSRHTMLLGIGAYIGISVVVQIVASIAMVFVIRQQDFFSNWWVVMNGAHPMNETAMLGMMNLCIGAVILFFAVFAVLYFVFTNLILKKKLNLE